jgi:hypothetical protein
VSMSTWNYEFPTPTADFRGTRPMVARYFCANLVGTDGRFTGGLRRFPGFKSITSVTITDPGDPVSGFNDDFGSGFTVDQDITFFKYVEIQKGSSSNQVVQGFVVRYGYTVIFRYTFDGGTNWADYTIDSYSAGEMDVTYGSRFLYYVKDKYPGKTIWWDEDTDVLTSTTFGHTGTPSLPYGISYIVPRSDKSNLVFQIPASPSTAVGHLVGWRLTDTRRGISTPLSWTTYAHTSASDYAIQMDLWVRGIEGEEYDTIEVYRSIQNGSNLYRSIYYCVPLEIGKPGSTLADIVGDNPFDIPRNRTEGFPIRVVMGADTHYEPEEGAYDLGASPWEREGYCLLKDDIGEVVLAQLTAYDSDLDNAGIEPTGGRIFHTDGVTILTGSRTTTGPSVNTVRFSKLVPTQPEVFPGDNNFSVSRVTDRIEKFVMAGDYIYGITSGRIYRFTRIGDKVSRERTAHGWGLVNRNGASEISTDFAMLGTGALVVVNGATGKMETIGAVEGIFNLDEEWHGHMDNCFLVYDQSAGALFVVNPDLEESLVIWGTTNTVSRLRDMRFLSGTSGVEIGGTINRAFFITPTGLILMPDTRDDEAPRTMAGILSAKTTNGVLTSTLSSYSMTDSGAAFTTGLKDCYLYINHQDGSFHKHLITDSTATSITTATLMTGAVNDVYSVAPVPFEVVGWPVRPNLDPELPNELFGRRSIESVGVQVRLPDGEYGQSQARLTVGVYDDPYVDPVQTAGFTVNAKACNNFGWTSAAGPILYPMVRCTTSDLRLEVTSLVVSGDIESTMDF